MLFYAQIDEEGYCFYVTERQEPFVGEDVIQIPTYDPDYYLLRKYDKVNGIWTGTKKEQNVSTPEIEQLKQQLLMHEELIFELAMMVYA